MESEAETNNHALEDGNGRLLGIDISEILSTEFRKQESKNVNIWIANDEIAKWKDTAEVASIIITQTELLLKEAIRKI